MARETTDASSFFSGIAGRLKEYASSFHDGMEECARVRADQMNDLEVARQRFADLFWFEHERYRPLNEHLIADFSRMRSPQIAPILEAEMYRIAEILTPLMREAGFDLGTDDSHIRREITTIWNVAQGTLQKKAFGSAKLPLTFVWRASQLAYEEQVWKRHGPRGKGYYGLLTNKFYGQKKAVLAA